ncbi:MAG TPA: PrsW family glutamic-type intramembrane protease [Thermoanaerobaculia bacterium]|nr:PrsW family glutamic-type intramembrane protease [Thermoanaerobaculia bacterium]
MNGQWYYVHNGAPAGPVETDVLKQLIAGGNIYATTYVWQDGMPAWLPASEVPGLVPALPPPPSVPTPSMPVIPPPSGRSILGEIGVSISRAAELPTLSGVPIREVLLGGLQPGVTTSHIEDLFIVGTETTTPDLATVPSGWPTPRVFWRIFFGAMATYLLLLFGLKQFDNTNFLPGMIVIGSFVVPLSIVILFFELNVPRNVSIYQIGKMILLGGALGLVATMLVGAVIPSGVGNVFLAMLTGVVEEVGKGLVLLIIIGAVRYRFQLNGLLFGAAVGAGFAGFESAGYAFNQALDAALNTHALEAVTSAATGNVLMRGLLAPGGHVIWTAMVGSALWKVKGDRPFQIPMLFHPLVIRRWLVAVVLHGIWDTDILSLSERFESAVPDILKDIVLLIVGWYIVFGILKQSLAEVEAARKAAEAASPAAAILSIVR